jgi:hypothetical protein
MTTVAVTLLTKGKAVVVIGLGNSQKWIAKGVKVHCRHNMLEGKNPFSL